MRKQGFTLIELLMVIAIIGILSVVVLTKLNESRERASDTRKISGSNAVAKAMEVSRDQRSGNFSTYSSTAAATIGLYSYLAIWPEGVVFIDNTSYNKRYCIYAPLQASNEGLFYSASEQSAGYRQSLPSITDCNPN